MTPKMQAIVEKYLYDAMSAEHPEVHVQLPGIHTPAGATLRARTWVLASDESTPVEVRRGSKSRNVGVVQVDVRGPRDQGAGETSDVAFFAARVFTRLHLEVPGEGWIKFRDPGVVDRGEQGEDYAYMMRCGYEYDFKVDPYRP